MATTQTISGYSAAITIDGANDFLLIEPSGNTVYKKISRNVLLGLASAPLGTTDSQSPTNKTFDNTNIFTIRDDRLTIQDNADTTKQAVFQLSGITTGTTRTYTMPNASTTLIGTDNTATLTNKTLTSPTISGGTIDNTTITVDSIAGHTSSTIVTVANLQISNGVLNSANAVTATSIAAGAVQPQALVAGTGSGWAMQSYTPTFTNLTVGNGTLVAAYTQIGKMIFVRMSLVFGSTSSITGNVSFTLPATSVSGYKTESMLGNGVFNGAAISNCAILWLSTTTVAMAAINAAGTYTTLVSTSSTIPTALSAGSDITATFWYEAV